MKKLIILSAFLCLTCASNRQAYHIKDIIAYYPSFRYTANPRKTDPARIPYDKVTMINYAFFAPDSSGAIHGLDPEADAVLLAETGEHSIVSLAHSENVKVVLSIGGWEDSGIFPFIASSPVLRSAFAGACNDAVRRYKFDGIDIDWEYPCFKPHNGTPDDTENFNLLLSTVRDSLDGLGKKQGDRLCLSAALSGSPRDISCLDLEKLSEILDFINLMTYDFHGAWDPVCSHNAPLYASGPGDSRLCVHGAVEQYCKHGKVPAEKLNIGIPFYGRAYKGCSSLFSPHNGPDTLIFSNGTCYNDIVSNIDRFTEFWDDTACVPYLVSLEDSIVVSYDNPRSVQEKCRYVSDNRLRGIILWEITGTILPDRSAPLLEEIHTYFSQSAK